MALISFAGPVYNKEAYIAEAIESLIAQTEKDIEIVFYDDGSTDDTKEIIKYYQKQDQRIRLIEGKKNVGLGIAWNKLTNVIHATALVKSPILAVISGDDIWTPDRAKLTLKGFEKNIDVFYGAFWNCDAGMEQLEFKPAVPFSREKLLTPRKDGYANQTMGHFVLAYRTEIGLKYPYDEGRRYGIDYSFITQLVRHNCKFGWTNKILGYARILKSGVSFTHRAEIVAQDKEMEKCLFLQKPNMKNREKR